MSLKYDSVQHTYKVGDISLESVTRHVSRHKTITTEGLLMKKFKLCIDDVAKALAIDDSNVSKELAVWKDKLKVAQDKGTAIHANIQDAFDKVKNNVAVTDPTALMLLEWLRVNEYEVISYEQAIFDEKMCMAGTYDAILGKGGKMYLVDWKTCRKIDATSQVKMLKPYHKLDDCNYNHYSLQLHLYKKMLAGYKIYIEDCLIVHISDVITVHKALSL